MFPVFKQVSAETVIRLCGKFYHLLYAYFLLNIVAKIIKIQRHTRELERKMSGSFFCETQCTHTLQRVMIAAARVVSDTRKFDHGLTQILHDDLHWLDVADRVRQGSAVPCRLLHTGHRCCRQAASQVSHTATDGGATTSAIHCWTPSIRCARPYGLEILAGRPPRTAGL